MSKVLIDRELLCTALKADASIGATAHELVAGWGAMEKLRGALLDTPSGTPAMPVKAYYHEAPNEYGGLNKSVGLDVRKAFTDAPLVLEADALARIACLEGEIAKRDARIAGLEAELVEARKCAEIMQQSAFAYQAELSAIKAQEPVAELVRWQSAIGTWFDLNVFDQTAPHKTKLYAAPVSEAKAQGVVQWPDADEIMQMAFEEGQPADDASGYCFELEEFDLFIERLMSEVARLNAATAAPAADSYSWSRKDGVNGIKQFMTQKCYAAQTDAIKQYYEPFKCANCKAADAGLVEALELAANRLDRLALEQGEFWRGYATAWADEARAAHRAKAVV